MYMMNKKTGEFVTCIMYKLTDNDHNVAATNKF